MKDTLLIALLLLPFSSLHAVPDGIAGPLIGAVEPDRVTLWMFAPAESACKYTYHSDDPGSPKSGKGQMSAVSDPAGEGPGRPFKSVVEGLSSDKLYHFKITVDGKSDPAWSGSFKTAPVKGKPAAFRLALTSCMKIGQPQASWYLLLAQQPDIHLTVGDTHYADTTDPTVQWKHHVNYRRQKEFATVLRNVPTYAIWDDHDYGPNNSDGTAKEKNVRWRAGSRFGQIQPSEPLIPRALSLNSLMATLISLWWTAVTTARRTKFRITTRSACWVMLSSRGYWKASGVQKPVSR